MFQIFLGRNRRARKIKKLKIYVEHKI